MTATPSKPEPPRPAPEPALPLQVVTRSGPVKAGRSGAFRWFSRLAVALGIFAAGVGLGRTRGPATVTPAADARAVGPRRVAGLGRLLPESGVIVLAPPHGSGDARVRSVRVGEGESAAPGDVLAVLDNESVLLAAVDSARAQLAVREAVADQVATYVGVSQREILAQLARAKVTESNSQREQRRAQGLWEAGALAQATLDVANTHSLEARHEVERLNASLMRVASGPIAKQSDVVVAMRNAELAKADLARVLSELERAYVRAPIAGTVLAVHCEAGERPGTAGLMNFGSIQRMKAEVEVYQSQISQIERGMRAEVTAPSLERPLQGVVSKVGLEIGKQVAVDASPAANTDARVVIVTVMLDEPSSELARRLTNLLVTARFEVGDAP